MNTRRFAVLLGALMLPLGCTRTVVVTPGPQPTPNAREPEPPRERERARPATPATLGIPQGHLPREGECRVWIPGVPPGRQRGARSRSCVGIAREAPAGSWVVYRPTRDRKLVYVRVVDQRRPGVIVVVRVFDVDSGRFLRDEAPEAEPQDERDDRDRRERPAPTGQPAPLRPPDPRRTPQERPRPTDPPPAPLEDPPGPARPPKPVDPTPTPQEGPGPFGERRKPEAVPAPVAPLDIPPGHLPSSGECRIWIPGTPPGRQPHRASGDCAGITREAPADSWVVYRPTADRKVVHVRVVHSRRSGVIVTVRVFDAASGRFLREERP